MIEKLKKCQNVIVDDIAKTFVRQPEILPHELQSSFSKDGAWCQEMNSVPVKTGQEKADNDVSLSLSETATDYTAC